MVESQAKTIKIEDADPETFKMMLRYIYCGRLPDELEANARKLLPLADKYDLPEVRDACVHWMEKSLSKENVCETLIMADLYRCPKLKKKCLKRLNRWKSEMADDIKTVLLDHPQLLLELVNIA